MNDVASQPRPWAPELVVDEALARRLIAARFPELAGAPVERWAAGWDNVAYLVADAWVFRFPQRAVAAPLLEREVRVLPRLAGRLAGRSPVAIPAPRFIGEPGDGYPWWFAGYARLPGETADRVGLDDAGRGALAAPLGRFLAALHGVGAGEAAAWGAGPDAIGKVDLGKRLPEAERRLAELVAAGVVRAAGPFEALLAATVARFGRSGAPPHAPTLLHGDLYSRHLLVDAGAFIGVIDWGDVHIGDPAVDIAVAHLLLPPAAHAAFRAAYGPIDEDRWALARFRALYHALATAQYGAETGDAPLLAESLVALGFLAAG